MTDTPKLYTPREGEQAAANRTHLYTLSSDGEQYETLCGDSHAFRTIPARDFTTSMVRVHPRTFEERDDSPCEACKETDTYSDALEQIDGSRGTSHSPESRWERYQEWIDGREWGNDKSPSEIRSEGKILVAPNYQKRVDQYDRKLHAYEQSDHGSHFVTKCGLDTGAKDPDELEGMEPKSFKSRAAACERCADLIDAEPRGGAASIDFDPFNVFDHGARDDGFPELPEEPDEYVCPDCGDSFSSDGIGQHWGHPKSDCDYPIPDDREKSILVGLWLSGGSIETQGTNPTLRKTGIRKYPLEWLKHELGVWGVDVSKSISRESQQETVSEAFGYTDAGSHQQYRLTTRSCPYLRELCGADVTDVELTPLAARILFSFKGHVIGGSAITIRHSDGDELVRLLHDAGFTETSLYEPDEGKNQWNVTLSSTDSRRFADWIGGDPLPGITQRSKQLTFREAGNQGKKPTRRVTVNGTGNDGEGVAPSDDVPVETVSLEPDWEWLGACLAELGNITLARRAFNEDLSPNEVYGGILDTVYANRDKLPTPEEVHNGMTSKA